MRSKGAARAIRSFFVALRRVPRLPVPPIGPLAKMAQPKIGLALGGGFARGIAHAGVLKVFEEHRIPIHCITGVSAGAIVAAALVLFGVSLVLNKASA